MNFDPVEQELLALLPGQFSIAMVSVIKSNQVPGSATGIMDLIAEDQGITWVNDEEQKKAISQQRAWVLLWYPTTTGVNLSVAAASLQACIDAATAFGSTSANDPLGTP
ncbi:hypothetical protein [Noviherbaspirillum malthae]|uniref:hypothetical protein n=1 Tax=Noviherbaspirillum malthae TaxID=1260987 RepID=UPI00188DD35E|nr:hypothetical protein [Noviherbaspirillum malthae]